MNVKAYKFFAAHISSDCLASIMLTFLQHSGILKRDLFQNISKSKKRSICSSWWHCINYILTKILKDKHLAFSRLWPNKEMVRNKLYYDLETCKSGSETTMLVSFFFLDEDRHYMVTFDIVHLTIFVVNNKHVHYTNLSNIRAGRYYDGYLYSAIANLVLFRTYSAVLETANVRYIFNYFRPLYEKMIYIQ